MKRNGVILGGICWNCRCWRGGKFSAALVGKMGYCFVCAGGSGIENAVVVNLHALYRWVMWSQAVTRMGPWWGRFRA
jgi:hypothetical protein